MKPLFPRRSFYTDILDAKIPQDKISGLYDGMAWYYDVWAHFTEKKAQDKAIELSKIEDGLTVLDVAVGTGKLFNRILKRNPNGINIGIDISKGMLTKAKSKLSNCLYLFQELGSHPHNLTNRPVLDYISDEK